MHILIQLQNSNQLITEKNKQMLTLNSFKQSLYYEFQSLHSWMSSTTLDVITSTKFRINVATGKGKMPEMKSDTEQIDEIGVPGGSEFELNI